MKNFLIFKSILFFCLLAVGILFIPNKSQFFKKKDVKSSKEIQSSKTVIRPEPVLDKEAYEKKLWQNANVKMEFNQNSTSSKYNLWPVKTSYPNYGAILPFNRIVAFYGNLYSKNMGVLGEYPEDVMLKKLNMEVEKWQKADPETPVLPALHYIAVVAQAGAGKDGKYRARMPDKEIDKVLAMAEKIQALVFLDVQVGLSDIQTELPYLEKYLKLPNVHLGVDPEFYMRNGGKPGEQIGAMDASDINAAVEYLAKLVKENSLTPKILVIHRFTKPMVTNYKNIQPLPEVQIVMDMDGFGSQGSKLNTYQQYIVKEPVQFTGFKLFYKNDSENSHKLLTPEQLLKLSPIPIYIQFQ